MTEPSTPWTEQEAVSESPEVSELEEAPSGEKTPDESIHWLQKFYDNPWILLVLGVLIPVLSYTVWGWIDLALIEQADLP